MTDLFYAISPFLLALAVVAVGWFLIGVAGLLLTWLHGMFKWK